MVSTPAVLRELEAKVAEEGGPPLLAGGSCINTFLTGGAAKRLMAVVLSKYGANSIIGSIDKEVIMDMNDK